MISVYTRMSLPYFSQSKALPQTKTSIVIAPAAKEQLERATNRVCGEGMEPSMLVDVLNGRRMKVEAILGNRVRMAKALDIEVPQMELLYGLIKALDVSTALRQPSQPLGGDEIEPLTAK